MRVALPLAQTLAGLMAIVGVAIVGERETVTGVLVELSHPPTV